MINIYIAWQLLNLFTDCTSRRPTAHIVRIRCPVFIFISRIEWNFRRSERTAVGVYKRFFTGCAKRNEAHLKSLLKSFARENRETKKKNKKSKKKNVAKKEEEKKIHEQSRYYRGRTPSSTAFLLFTLFYPFFWLYPAPLAQCHSRECRSNERKSSARHREKAADRIVPHPHFIF